MARTVETELVGTQETVRQREVPKHGSLEQPGRESQDPAKKAPSRRVSRWMLLVVFGIALTGTSLWWLHSQNYESTDDAQVEGHLDLVSARISGTVTYINPGVENNQFVKAGTLLIELDPRDFEADLEHAKANLNTRDAEAQSAQVLI